MVEKSLPDSGIRETFGEGMALREADPSKPALDGISPFALLRLGALMTKAGVKYKDGGGFRNWEKGLPLMRYYRAILGHALAWAIRDDKEDHMAAIMWNAMCIMHHEEVGSTSGKTFADLDDRPRWR